MALLRPEDYMIEIGPMGPIGEGQALILRVNRNCPWNRCMFCPVYKGKRFNPRSVDEIKGDIDAVHRIWDLLNTASWEIGLNGKIQREVLQEVMLSHPEIYGEYPINFTQEQLCALQSLNNVANWLFYGATRVFLQDANALVMNPKKLIEVLKYLRQTFPTVEVVACYARSKTCEMRSFEEMRELKDAGLSWCFVGIESGCDEVLDYMRKGVTRKEHIKGGQKVMVSGLNMAAFVMPGLSGNNKELADKHISDTIIVLNDVQPTEIRVRSLAILECAPLYERWEAGEFTAPSEDQMVEELRLLIEELTFDCTIETLQMTNPLFTIKGRLSQKRQEMLEMIAWYQGLSPLEKADFLLHRYVDDGYLACVKSWGKYDSYLKALIEDANLSLEKGSPEAAEKVGRAIFAIKSKGVP